MKCPFCGNDEDKVVDSRPFEDGSTIRRRRECSSCQSRFTTYEKVEMMPVFVTKKDGRKQPFDRSKLMNGLIRACAKRPLTATQLEQIVSDVEKSAQSRSNSEIATDEIGEIVLMQLKNLDEVAYIRFASVYRDFNNIESFLKELELIRQDKQE